MYLLFTAHRVAISIMKYAILSLMFINDNNNAVSIALDVTVRCLLQSIRVHQSNALPGFRWKSRANSVSDRIYIPLSSEVERSFGSLHQETFTRRADSRSPSSFTKDSK